MREQPRSQDKPAPSAEVQTAEPAGKPRGRKRAKPLELVAEKIERAGGQLEGSMSDIGEKLGLTKSSAHRALHALAAAGL